MDKIELKIDEWINQDKIFYPLFLLLAILTFLPMVSSPTLVDIDYVYVFKPLNKLSSLAAFFRHEVQIVDLQPIRDLFMLFMLKVNSYFSHQLLGSFNLSIWILSVLVLEKILVRFTTLKTARLVSLCVLLHPIAAWTLYWPTAIKHLLALFFISLAALYTLKFKESNGANGTGLKVFLFYLLAINSQPIIILFPIMLILFLHQDLKKKSYFVLITLTLITMTLFAGFNYFYYRDVYPLLVGSPKMDPVSIEGFALNLFGLSRSLSQIFIPFSFAINYSFSSFLNFIGLPVFVFFAIMLSQRSHWKILLFQLGLILFPLGTIYGKTTNVFVSDTYLLVPLFSFSIFLTIHFFKNYSLNKFLLLVIITLGIKSHFESKITTEENSIFKTSYLREPECKNALSYASNLLLNLKVDRFKRIANTTIANNCLLTGGGASVLSSELYSLLIFFNTDTSYKRRIELIEGAKNKTPIIYFVLDLLKIKTGDLTTESPNFKNIQERHINSSRKNLYRKLKEGVITF